MKECDVKELLPVECMQKFWNFYLQMNIAHSSLKIIDIIFINLDASFSLNISYIYSVNF